MKDYLNILNGTEPAFIQIAKYYRDRFLNGDIPTGTEFPSMRSLADLLGLPLNSFIQAIDLLASEGYVDKSRKKITVIYETKGDKKLFDWNYFIRRGDHYTKINTMTTMSEYIHAQVYGNKCFVNEEFGFTELYKSSLNKAADNLTELPYLIRQTGDLELLERIAGLLEERGIKATPDELMIVSNDMMSFYIIFMYLLSSKATILYSTPCRLSPFNMELFAHMHTASLKTDEKGILPDDLYTRIKRSTNPVLFIEPRCMWPEGQDTDPERMLEIAELCSRLSVPIIECDAMWENLVDDSTRPIKANDTAGNVIYNSSFFPLFNPADNFAFLAAPEPVIRRLSVIYSQINATSSYISQQLVLEILKNGAYLPFIEGFRKQLAERHEQTYALMDKYLTGLATWERPKNGIIVPITFNQDRNIFKMALDDTSCNWFPDVYCEDFDRKMLLLITSCTVDKLEEFIASLARKLKE